jgi:hypothetical protein
MRILFSMRHAGALRNFASTIAELARRGHQVHLAFMMRNKLGDRRLLLELAHTYPAITHGKVKTPERLWFGLASAVRAAADYVRYGAREYSGTHALRKRAGRGVPLLRRLLRAPGLRSERVWRRAARLLAAIERALPTDRSLLEFIAARQPDVLLVTPLIDIGSDQVEYVKAAKALGVPTGLCVHSWDNLTNKGLMRVVPDRVFVWNEAQKREAIALHGAVAAQVVVSGAPVFDQWFGRQPSTTREEFCAMVGLSPETPFFLYLCSSKFIAPDEAVFVERWIRAVRSAADPRVRAAGLLVRPHPNNAQRWERIAAIRDAHVALWPREGANPVDAGSRNDYFDSLYHAVAAVGINTTAQIEAGIVGCPVYSVQAYGATQHGTLHFRHLLQENGGPLHLSATLAEHTQALAGALDRTAADAAVLRTFVQAFVRPHGADRPAGPILADAIEALARDRVPGAPRVAATAYVLRMALYPVAATTALVRHLTRPAREHERSVRRVKTS